MHHSPIALSSLFLVLSFTLVGCQTGYWAKHGVTQVEVNRDSYECKTDNSFLSRQTVTTQIPIWQQGSQKTVIRRNSRGGYTRTTYTTPSLRYYEYETPVEEIKVDRRMYNSCMAAKGYFWHVPE